MTDELECAWSRCQELQQLLKKHREEYCPGLPPADLESLAAWKVRADFAVTLNILKFSVANEPKICSQKCTLQYTSPFLAQSRHPLLFWRCARVPPAVAAAGRRPAPGPWPPPRAGP